MFALVSFAIGLSERGSGVPGAFPPRTWELILFFFGLWARMDDKALGLSLAVKVFEELWHDTSYTHVQSSLRYDSKNCPPSAIYPSPMNA